jgi:hypothetical protein
MIRSLVLLCLALAASGCVTVIDTSGAPASFAPVDRLAIETVHTDYSKVEARGDTGETTRWNWRVQQFSDQFLYLFSATAPEHFAKHNVTVIAPQRGVPLLRVAMNSFEIGCEGSNSCSANLDFVGELYDADHKRVWTFGTKIHADQMDRKELLVFEDELIDRMVKDHLIAK